MVALVERVPFRPSIEIPFNSRGVGGSAEGNLAREDLQEQIKKSIYILLGEQHPQTRLFPAATRKRFIKEKHYDDPWVRDNALDFIALLDPVLRKVGDPVWVNRGRKAAVEGIKGSLALFAKEPWKSAFEQEIEVGRDNRGRDCTKLTKPAPPIHFKIDGKDCYWETQNQPDSWGSFLIAVGQAVSQDALRLTDEQIKTVVRISSFLQRARVDKLQQHSMWEWELVYRPVPTSTLALCAKGLELVDPIVSGYQQELNRRTARRLREIAQSQYPEEYTVATDHRGKSDMATLVAAHAGALNGSFLSHFFKIANPELGNDRCPGKKRYLGDHYFRAEKGEAIWPMGALLEASLFLEKARNLYKNDPSSMVAEYFRQMGLRSLRKVQELVDEYGYIPELLQNKKEGLISNGNDLLWNQALMLQASGRALVLV